MSTLIKGEEELIRERGFRGWTKVLEEIRMKSRAKVEMVGLILIGKKDALSTETEGKW